jgi:hypothetical protein
VLKQMKSFLVLFFKKELLPPFLTAFQFENATIRARQGAAPHHRFAERSRRTQAIAPRGIGTRPKSGFTRTRDARTGATARTTPGRNTCVSIANIRHTGVSTRTAWGHAASNATTSGVSSTARS